MDGNRQNGGIKNAFGAKMLNEQKFGISKLGGNYSISSFFLLVMKSKNGRSRRSDFLVLLFFTFQVLLF